MGFKSWVKQGIGLVGKHLMNAANAYTGCLAGKIINKGVEQADKNAGLIGSGLRWIGNKILNDDHRQKLRNFVDKALDYIPDSKLKNTLSKINDAAQGRDINAVGYAEPKQGRRKNEQHARKNGIQTIERGRRKSS